MKYQSRETIEAIGFQELVEIALDTEGANIVNGVPWSFHYEGWPVTHENDDLYLVGIAGGQTAKFHRGDFLVIDEKRHLWVMSPEELHKLYAPLDLVLTDGDPRTDECYDRAEAIVTKHRREDLRQQATIDELDAEWMRERAADAIGWKTEPGEEVKP